MQRFYAPKEKFSADTVELDRDETRHLRDVLRLRIGDIVNVFDGEGREYSAEIEQIQKLTSTLLIREEVSPEAPESNLDLTIAAAILKSDKTDLVVQKAVELGVSKFVPLYTARTDVKPIRGSRKSERWQKIALEAAKQCGRARLLKVSEPLLFSDFINSFREESASGQRIMFSERHGSSLPESDGGKAITAVFGPEGGWNDSEIDLARQCGFTVVTFGGRILRAETAGIAIAGILQHRYGDFN